LTVLLQCDFVEGTGKYAYDKSGNGFHGILKDGVQWVANPYGDRYCVDLSHGLGEYADFGLAPAAAPAAFTLRLLLKIPAGGDQEGFLLAKNDSGVNDGDTKLMLGSGKITFSEESTGDKVESVYPLDEWFVLYVTWDGSTLKMFLNNEEKDSISSSANFWSRSTQRLWLGALWGQSQYQVDVLAGKLLFTDYAFTPEQIETDLAAVLNPPSVDWGAYRKPRSGKFLFRMAQITDTHVGYDEEQEPIMRSVCNWLASQKDIKLVLHTGDITHNPPTESRFQQARANMDLLTQPWATVPGNHDTDDGNSMDLYNTYFPEHSAYSYQLVNIDCGILNCGLLLIKMGTGAFSIPTEKLEWMDNILQTYQNVPAIIISHQALRGRSGYPVFIYENRDEIMEHLATHKNVLFWLNGHEHMSFETILKADGKERVGKYKPIHMMTGEAVCSFSWQNPPDIPHAGFVKLFDFYDDHFEVKGYSPYTDTWYLGVEDQYDVFLGSFYYPFSWINLPYEAYEIGNVEFSVGPLSTLQSVSFINNVLRIKSDANKGGSIRVKNLPNNHSPDMVKLGDEDSQFTFNRADYSAIVTRGSDEEKLEVSWDYSMPKCFFIS